MRALLAVVTGLTVLILAAAAFAQTPGSKPTLASGPGNNCAAQFYPASAIRMGEQGSTTMNVHIDETGKVSGVDVVTSSGFADLDDAAKSCVTKGWHFTPATQNGKPVAGTKEYRIVWKLMGPVSTAPQLQSVMESTCESIFSDAPNRWRRYQSVTLQFRITSAGAVLHPFVATSSGDALFDVKAVKCATLLKYKAAVIEDVPSELSWSAAVRWSPHTGLAYSDGYGLSFFCADTTFPASIWNGDPPNATTISYHLVQGGTVAAAAIERSSGNPALDQAALQCVSRSKLASAAEDPPLDFGAVVRFNWRDGHAFILDDAWK